MTDQGLLQQQQQQQQQLLLLLSPLLGPGQLQRPGPLGLPIVPLDSGTQHYGWLVAQFVSG
jgi:hypothetical protein